MKFNRHTNSRLALIRRQKVNKSIRSLLNLLIRKGSKEKKKKKKIIEEVKRKYRDWKNKLSFSQCLNIPFHNLSRKKLYQGLLLKHAFHLVWRRYKLRKKKERERFLVWLIKNTNFHGNSFPMLPPSKDNLPKNKKILNTLNTINSHIKYLTTKVNKKGWS